MNSSISSNFIQEFYTKNEELLLKNYPGLTIKRLENDFSNYSSTGLNSDVEFFEKVLEGVPLEYITGRAYFYKSEFTVNSSVLIPRNETEILVELSSREIKKWSKKTDELLRVADIGTGSGCIALSLLADSQRPLHLTATDVSKEALVIAKKNDFLLRYSYPKTSKLELLFTDRLKDVEHKQHVIVSNPPYIKKEKDQSLVHSQVNEFEPHLALYLEDAEYSPWFQELFETVHDHLLEEGVFLMEGHEDNLEELEIMAKRIFSKVKLEKDYNDSFRFLIARK